MFFFFQAEDGIRDDLVTGVQTCALPISSPCRRRRQVKSAPSGPNRVWAGSRHRPMPLPCEQDRKSTRLNSSHQIISYAVFCLKKKKNKNKPTNSATAMSSPPSTYYCE